MTGNEREQMWQQHITAWQASGLSGLSYCKEHSLTYSRFVYWRRKLVAAQTASDAPEASGFARATTVCEVPGPQGLTVSLPGGVSVTALYTPVLPTDPFTKYFADLRPVTFTLSDSKFLPEDR